MGADGGLSPTQDLDVADPRLTRHSDRFRYGQLTRSAQRSGFGIGQGSRCGLSPRASPDALLYGHSSARSTSPARTGFASTYRQAFRNCISLLTATLR